MSVNNSPSLYWLGLVTVLSLPATATSTLPTNTPSSGPVVIARPTPTHRTATRPHPPRAGTRTCDGPRPIRPAHRSTCDTTGPSPTRWRAPLTACPTRAASPNRATGPPRGENRCASTCTTTGNGAVPSKPASRYVVLFCTTAYGFVAVVFFRGDVIS